MRTGGRITLARLGERVARDGVFTSRRGPGEGAALQKAHSSFFRPTANRAPAIARKITKPRALELRKSGPILASNGDLLIDLETDQGGQNQASDRAARNESGGKQGAAGDFAFLPLGKLLEPTTTPPMKMGAVVAIGR